MKRLFGYMVLGSILCTTLALASIPASQSSIVDTIGREYQLIRVEADGFTKLSRRDQLLAYYLFRAGLPGRDTFFDLNHRHAPTIKQILETFLNPVLEAEASGKPLAIDAATLTKIKQYAGIFFINSCQYNVRSKVKYTLELGGTPAESQALFLQALATSQGGKDGALAPTLKDKVIRVASSLFDPKFEPILFITDTNHDFIGESHINYYDPGVKTADVTIKDSSGKPVANRFNQVVNSRIKKTASGPVEQIFSVETPTKPEPGREYGLFKDELARSITWLKLAQATTGSKQQQQTLGHYIAFLRSGDEKAFWDANRSWLHDKDFTVDFTFGWVEQYMDPLGVKGAWQTSVAYIDPDLNKVMQRLADKKMYFETKMPWSDVYKISGDKIAPPKVDVHMLVHQNGFLQAMTIAGINLPNNEEIRKTDGAKNMILQNNSEAFDRARSVAFEEEFMTAEGRALSARWGSQPARLMTALHEVIGHGSGKMRDGLNYSDLGTHYGALEENRADLSAIYNAVDPLIAEIDLVQLPDANGDVATQLRELQYAMLLKKISSAYGQLRTTKSDSINQEHQQGDTMALNWLRWGVAPLLTWASNNRGDAKGNIQWLNEQLKKEGLEPQQGFGVVIEATSQPSAAAGINKRFVMVKERERAIKGVTVLLGLMQMAKGSGDRDLVDALFTLYVNPESGLTEFFGPLGKDGKRRGGYRAELQKRAEKLDIQNAKSYISPTLNAVKNGTKIERIELDYPKNLNDFLRQQLLLSRLSLTTE